MRHKTLKRIAILIALVVFFALVGCWIMAGVLTAPINRVVGPPPLDFPSETIELQTDNGKVAGWYSPPAASSSSHSTVLLLHPNGGDRRDMLSRAKLIRAAGFTTLLIDLPAHGESMGSHVSAGYFEKSAVCQAVQFIRRRTPEHKIVILGRSLGGAAAVLASPDVDALVLEAVYPTIADAVHNRVELRLGPIHYVIAPLLLMQMEFRLGIDKRHLRPVDQINQIRCPVLIVAGDLDERTTAEETQQLFAAANAPKKLALFSGAAHQDLLAYDSEKYKTEVLGFLRAALQD